MTRYSQTSHGKIPWTAEQEAERDAEEAEQAVLNPLTIENIRKNKIERLKKKAGMKLKETDWYYTRSLGAGGKPVPQSIEEERIAIRSDMNAKEILINAETDRDAMRKIKLEDL